MHSTASSKGSNTSRLSSRNRKLAKPPPRPAKKPPMLNFDAASVDSDAYPDHHSITSHHSTSPNSRRSGNGSHYSEDSSNDSLVKNYHHHDNNGKPSLYAKMARRNARKRFARAGELNGGIKHSTIVLILMCIWVLFYLCTTYTDELRTLITHPRKFLRVAQHGDKDNTNDIFTKKKTMEEDKNETATAVTTSGETDSKTTDETKGTGDENKEGELWQGLLASSSDAKGKDEEEQSSAGKDEQENQEGENNSDNANKNITAMDGDNVNGDLAMKQESPEQQQDANLDSTNQMESTAAMTQGTEENQGNILPNQQEQQQMQPGGAADLENQAPIMGNNNQPLDAGMMMTMTDNNGISDPQALAMANGMDPNAAGLQQEQQQQGAIMYDGNGNQMMMMMPQDGSNLQFQQQQPFDPNQGNMMGGMQMMQQEGGGTIMGDPNQNGQPLEFDDGNQGMNQLQQQVPLQQGNVLPEAMQQQGMSDNGMNMDGMQMMQQSNNNMQQPNGENAMMMMQGQIPNNGMMDFQQNNQMLQARDINNPQQQANENAQPLPQRGQGGDGNFETRQADMQTGGSSGMQPNFGGPPSRVGNSDQNGGMNNMRDISPMNAQQQQQQQQGMQQAAEMNPQMGTAPFSNNGNDPQSMKGGMNPPSAQGFVPQQQQQEQPPQQMMMMTTSNNGQNQIPGQEANMQMQLPPQGQNQLSSQAWNQQQGQPNNIDPRTGQMVQQQQQLIPQQQREPPMIQRRRLFQNVDVAYPNIRAHLTPQQQRRQQRRQQQQQPQHHNDIPTLPSELTSYVANHPWYSNLEDFDKNLPFDEKTQVPYFWHIHKSGGSTMKHLMTCLDRCQTRRMSEPKCNDQEEQLHVCPLEWGKVVNADASSPKGIERLRRLDLVDQNIPDLVIDTSRIFEALPILSPQHKGRLFMILRHPVERAISKYYYTRIAKWERNYKPEIAEMTIEQYAVSKYCFGNWIVRRLVHKMDPRYQVTREDLQLAKEILRQKALILLTSRMEEAGLRVMHYFGWPFDGYQRWCINKFAVNEPINQNPHPIPPRDSSEWNALAEQNKYDVELYDYALELYDLQGHFLNAQFGELQLPPMLENPPEGTPVPPKHVFLK